MADESTAGNPQAAEMGLSGRISSTKLKEYLKEHGNVLTLNSGWAANG